MRRNAAFVLNAKFILENSEKDLYFVTDTLDELDWYLLKIKSDFGVFPF